MKLKIHELQAGLEALGVWKAIQNMAARASSGTTAIVSGVSSFLGLSDAPSSYSGQGGKIVKVKVDESGLEFGSGVVGGVAWGEITGNLEDQTDLQDVLTGLVVDFTAALALKVDKTITINGHALSADVTITKGDVGLGNVDNTSDANKPVSTATQTALDLKVPTSRTVNGQALSSNVTLTTDNISEGSTNKYHTTARVIPYIIALS